MKKQHGFTLIELILAVGLATLGTIFAFQEKLEGLQQTQAVETGRWLVQYNNAVREWTSANIGAPAQTKSGSAWLKSTTCAGGLSAVDYLPCNFPAATAANPIPGGNISLSTNISTAGAAPNLITTALTTTSPYQIKSGQVRSDLAGLAALVASSGSSNSDPASGSVDGTIKSQVTTGVISMVASNNGSADPWLRSDGSNTMNNPLKFDSTNPANMREIQGVSRIQNIAANVLTLGNAGGGTAGYSIVVDANKTVTATVDVANVANAATAVQTTRGNVRTQSGNMSASGNITSNGSTYAKRFVSSANGAMYFDPDQQSVTKQINIYGPLSANILYDRNNPGYYIDPTNTSILNNVYADQGTSLMAYFNNLVTVNGIMTISHVDATGLKNDEEGQNCATGTMSTSQSLGGLLNCANGTMLSPVLTMGDIYTPSIPAGTTGVQTMNLGRHRFCYLFQFNPSPWGNMGCYVAPTGDAGSQNMGTWTATLWRWTPNGELLCNIGCDRIQ